MVMKGEPYKMTSLWGWQFYVIFMVHAIVLRFCENRCTYNAKWTALLKVKKQLLSANQSQLVSCVYLILFHFAIAF